MRYLVAVILITSVFYSCNKKSDKILSEEKFTEVMADMFFYDAIAEHPQLKQSELIDMDSIYLYSNLFLKHHVSKQQFDTSLYYYAQTPEILLEITENAYSLLEARSEKVNQYNAELKKSTEIWKNASFLYFNGDVGNKKEIINVPIDTTGIFKISTTIRLYDNDKSIRPYIYAYFMTDTLAHAEKIDFPKIPVFKTEFTREYVLVKELSDTNYKFISIHIVESENTDTNYYRNLTVNKLDIRLIEEEKQSDNEEKPAVDTLSTAVDNTNEIETEEEDLPKEKIVTKILEDKK